MPDMSASLAMTHLVPLAAELNDDKVTPGVLGFVVFAALALGVWMLMKSMNRHMGKVSFEEAPDASPSTDTPAAAPAKGAPNKA
ncbi:hypothetical protein [Streptomyces sp. NBC_00083]|uniref:hypothetical protein n=1 Tax=Streptomyces sp. NBC_00083 TaxID=2975647 RepID=UPI0022522214|nr:hypothetical protein [Streptomyces sp. NBC_00083]MCX5385286.1 hypothetical protein [Streptomyces sp. NBC_00083]